MNLRELLGLEKSFPALFALLRTVVEASTHVLDRVEKFWRSLEVLFDCSQARNHCSLFIT